MDILRCVPVENPSALLKELCFGKGWVAYQAPELLRQDVEPSLSAVNIYAFGVVLYELISGFKPYEDLMKTTLGEISIMERVSTGSLRPELCSSTWGEKLAEIVRDCCSWEVTDRPTASEIVTRLQSI